MNFISKTKLITFSIIILSVFITVPAYADQIEDKITEQQIILDNINTKQQELDRLSNTYIEALEKQGELENNIQEIEIEIEQTNQDIQNNQEKLKRQCKSLYQNNKITLLDIVLESKNFNDFVVRIDFYNKFINQTNYFLNEHKELKNKLLLQQEKQQEEQKELNNIIQEIERDKENAAAIIEDLQSQYNNLDNEIIELMIQQFVVIEDDQEYFIDFSSDVPIAAQIYQNEEAEAQITSLIESYSGNNDVVARAYSMLGSPYSWGGVTSSGFDCSGFVSYCLTGEETRLGTTETFSNWTQVSDPQPGDICVIHDENSQHTGVYVGDGNMVHAATYGVGVIESPVQDGMIYVRYE